MSLIITAELAYQNYLEQVHYNPKEYEEKRDKPVHRASSGGRCHRLQKYHVETEKIEVTNDDGEIEIREVKKHKPKKLTPETMAVFRIGTVFHSELQQGMNWLINEKNKDNENITLEMEKKVSVNMSGCQIDGHFDIRLFDHKNKIIQITDLKTMNPRQMSYFKKDPYSKKGYIIQVGVYAYATKLEFPDYDIVILLSAWDKDKGNFFEIELDYNICVMKADNYYKELSASMKLELDDLVPIQHPKSPINPKWECDYCQYNHICPSPEIKKR